MTFNNILFIQNEKSFNRFFLENEKGLSAILSTFKDVELPHLVSHPQQKYQGNSIPGFSGILAQMTAKVTATPANVGN